MLTYCLKCTQNTENVDSKVLKTKNDRTMSSLKWAVCSNTKSRFMKEQAAKGLLCSLGLKTPLNNIPLSGDILF